jgi:thiol-disulfide isomerase/thioredoxin
MPPFVLPLPPARPLTMLCGIAVVLSFIACPASQAADPAAPPRSSSRSPTVPAVPDGSPAELLAYIESLADPAALPKSRGRLRYYLRKAAAASAEAAGKIIAQTAPDDPLHDRGIALKLDALQTMEQLGEPGAAEALAAFATSLGELEDEALAARVRRVAVAVQIDAAVASGRPEDAALLVPRVAAAVKAAPADAELAKTAASLALKLAEMPGGEPAAAAAFGALLPLFEISENPAVRGLAEELGGPARRISLPGRPMQITGTLLSGESFDSSTLAGKVVLVDFWATWCGPCVAEIGNLRKEYDRWHDKGFEVVGVSLDEDRAALERFVTAKQIPWPILYEEPGGPGWRHPLASYYGITGIPTVVLIGADGNVITLDARGKKLGAALERLLGEPRDRIGDRRPTSPVTP